MKWTYSCNPNCSSAKPWSISSRASSSKQTWELKLCPSCLASDMHSLRWLLYYAFLASIVSSLFMSLMCAQFVSSDSVDVAIKDFNGVVVEGIDGSHMTLDISRMEPIWNNSTYVGRGQLREGSKFGENSACWINLFRFVCRLRNEYANSDRFGGL